MSKNSQIIQKQLVEKLQAQITVISDEVSQILHLEDVCSNRVAPHLAKSNIDQHSRLAIFQNHYTAVMSGVRRQLGLDSSEISLMNLLNTLLVNNTYITKAWYSNEWLHASQQIYDDPIISGFMNALPGPEFERNFGKEYLSKEVVEQDIALLKASTATIKCYVDKKIAHKDKKDPDPVTEDNYKFALIVIEKTTTKYILLLKQVGMSSLTPIMQD